MFSVAFLKLRAFFLSMRFISSCASSCLRVCIGSCSSAFWFIKDFEQDFERHGPSPLYLIVKVIPVVVAQPDKHDDKSLEVNTNIEINTDIKRRLIPGSVFDCVDQN